MLVVAGEIRSDAKQPSAAPLDTLGHLLAQTFHHQPAELGLMVEQPIEIEQPLVDDILVAVALVLDDDWAAVFIQP